MTAVAVATALALGATFLPVFDNQADQAPTSRIEVAPLPPGDAPESTFDDRAALLTHPDFDMLADPSADDPAARDPGFHSWLAAGATLPDTQPAAHAHPRQVDAQHAAGRAEVYPAGGYPGGAHHNTNK